MVEQVEMVQQVQRVQEVQVVEADIVVVLQVQEILLQLVQRKVLMEDHLNQVQVQHQVMLEVEEVEH